VIAKLVIWLASPVSVIGVAVLLKVLLTVPTPFATVHECECALMKWQRDNGHHREKCVEIEGGGWCIYDYGGGGEGYCVLR
jgi:hypothetical protein